MSSIIATLSGNIADLLLDVVFLVDANGILIDVSAGCEKLLGYRRDELISRPLFDFVAEQDRARTLEEAACIQSGVERIGFENRYVRKDGSLVDIMWSARRIEALGLRIGVARDITARKQAERRQAALYAVSEAAHQAPDLPSLCAQIHAILDELVGVADMAVYTDDGGGGQRPLYPKKGGTDPCEALQPGTPLAPGWLALELGGRTGLIGELLLRSRDGAAYPAPDRELLQFTAGQVGMALERKRLQDDLLRHACHDELTGLPNRYLFFDRVGTAFARARRAGTRMGLLYVDVDDFKQVNDCHGHAAGDALLREVARRLSACARDSDTVARLGGDEFVLILEDLNVSEDAERIARQIDAAMQAPIGLEGVALHVRTSIGSAVFPDDGQHVEDLLKHADIAMYRQKRGRKSAPADPAPGPATGSDTAR
jgi:diguanylate cyclase (GGDEF)-like protein/PAS domain S-box-containing protein